MRVLEVSKTLHSPLRGKSARTRTLTPMVRRHLTLSRGRVTAFNQIRKLFSPRSPERVSGLLGAPS
jgi:hypothetical protein